MNEQPFSKKVVTQLPNLTKYHLDTQKVKQYTEKLTPKQAT